MVRMAVITDRYDRHATSYGRWWAPVLERTALSLLDAVATMVDGDGPARILDVGTGTGVLALAAARRWPSASVVGLDGSAGMLGVARADAERRLPPDALGRLEWRSALAERLPFEDGTFDMAVSSFVYQLVPDRLAALREACRVLVPGGILAYVTWLDADEDFAPQAAFEDLVAEEGLDERFDLDDGRSGDLASPAAAAAQLRRAGFRDVRARPGWLEHRWTARSYLEFLERYEAADVFDSLDRVGRARLRRRMAERLAVLAAEDLAWRAPVVTAVGRRPG